MIGIVVILLPTISELGVIPLFFAICMIALGIAVVFSAFRSSGLIGWEISEEEKPVPKVKPHKQTYLEYVRERRAIEKIIHS